MTRRSGDSTASSSPVPPGGDSDAAPRHPPPPSVASAGAFGSSPSEDLPASSAAFVADPYLARARAEEEASGGANAAPPSGQQHQHQQHSREEWEAERLDALLPSSARGSTREARAQLLSAYARARSDASRPQSRAPCSLRIRAVARYAQQR